MSDDLRNRSKVRRTWKNISKAGRRVEVMNARMRQLEKRDRAFRPEFRGIAFISVPPDDESEEEAE